MRPSLVLHFLCLTVLFHLIHGSLSAQSDQFLTLPPTLNNYAIVQGCILLEWEMPELNPGDPVPAGIKILRDNSLIDSVKPSTTFCYDRNIHCGFHEYWLTIIYEVSPGNFIESDTSNHLVTSVQYGVHPLPHSENWESCNFSYNNWHVNSPSTELLQVIKDSGSSNCYCRFGSYNSLDGSDISLTSFYIPTTLLQGSELVVSFDLKCLQTSSEPDTFRLSVINRNDEPYFVSRIISSTDSTWKHYSFSFPMTDPGCVRLRWTSTGAEGHNSPEWHLDNLFYTEHPSPAFNLQVSQINYGNSLTWSAPENQSLNNLRRSLIIRYLNGDSIASFYSSDTILFDNISQPWKYCYTVTIEYNTLPHRIYSDPTPVICSDYAGIMNREASVFSFSPNPVNNNICIRYNGHEAKLLLSDLTGQVVFEKSIPSSPTGEYRVNLPATLPDGLYLVRLNQPNNDQITRKLIISR